MNTARKLLQRSPGSATLSSLERPKRKSRLKGHPGKVIPEFAKRRGTDIVVLGSGYRKGVTDVVVGTTTQRILDDVPCSVFAVKPKEFVSPVELDES